MKTSRLDIFISLILLYFNKNSTVVLIFFFIRSYFALCYAKFIFSIYFYFYDVYSFIYYRLFMKGDLGVLGVLDDKGDGSKYYWLNIFLVVSDWQSSNYWYDFFLIEFRYSKFDLLLVYYFTIIDVSLLELTTFLLLFWIL